jgi:hypothetical protein
LGKDVSDALKNFEIEYSIEAVLRSLKKDSRSPVVVSNPFTGLAISLAVGSFAEDLPFHQRIAFYLDGEGYFTVTTEGEGEFRFPDLKKAHDEWTRRIFSP